MRIYWFEREKRSNEELIKITEELKKSGFYGVMYPYGPGLGDYFTRVSRMMDEKDDFKYLIAVRPYNISPQYLSMICSSISDISDKRVEINLLTGYISDKEKEYGGTIEEINDHSSNIERSNYMINYAKELKNISNIDFFVSTTNEHVFNVCSENKLPMLFPYVKTQEKWFKLNEQKILLMIQPVIGDKSDEEWNCKNDNGCRHPEGEECSYLDFFTEDSFIDFLKKCENDGIYGILFQESMHKKEQYEDILLNVKKYLDKKQLSLDL